MAQLTVQIVTPDGLVYDHHASYVSVRTLDGEMGILPRHENMIAVLAVDEVKVKRIDDEDHVNWIAVTEALLKLPIIPSQSLLILQNVLVISMLAVQNVLSFVRTRNRRSHENT